MIYSSKDKFLYVNVWEGSSPDDILNFIKIHEINNLVIDSTSEPFLFEESHETDELLYSKLNKKISSK